MTFTVEQKSQLAKLMATENLRVEHQKIKTAKFDPQNRVLYLPIWKDMSGILYDLLCGHEVGHALFTPAEGWHDVVTDKTKPKAYKHFLNVIEDARIEKKVKRRYPGLKLSFQKAYIDLHNRDFFGIKNRDINDMPFIDRLNIYTKSQYSNDSIIFSEQEKKMVSKVENLETWDDVLKLTSEVYEYSKDEQYEMAMSDFEYSSDEQYDDSDEFGDTDFDFGDETTNDSEKLEKTGNNTNNSNADDGESTDESSNEKSDDSDESDKTGEDVGDKINRFKHSQASDKDTFVPSCRTDEEFREKEDVLLDESCKPYLYLDMPTPIFENIITPVKRVQEQISEYYLTARDGYPAIVSVAECNTWVAEFKKRNERYVGLLAKEFEMRKAAKSFSKSKLSDTGDIDISKLASYKFDDNIFRKVMLTPKGKNHGLVLLLDKSGSMSENMPGSIEQILILAMFCRKVNIPFVVYGFGDSTEARAADLDLKNHVFHEKLRNNEFNCFSNEEKQLDFGSVYVREYLNSKMNNREFSIAMRNMIILKKAFEGNRYHYNRMGRPNSEHLSNTPLSQAVYVCGFIMNRFRKQYNLDMSSLVIVHDGDSDWCTDYLVKMEYLDYNTGEKKVGVRRNRPNTYSTNVIIRDTKNKFESHLKNNDAMLSLMLDWFRKTTNSKVFGFFLTSTQRNYIRNALYNRYVYENGDTLENLRLEASREYRMYEFNIKRDELVKKFKSEKFLSSKVAGYNEFYLVLGGEEMTVEEDVMEIGGKITANKLKNAFMKMNKKKSINRVLVSKFIQGIAA